MTLSELIARQRARLHVLDNIQVARPCSADWNAMTGDDRVRRCGDCRQNVYNFSAMTRAQAEAVIVEHEGRMCSRYFARADGTILLADCTYRPRHKALLAGAAAAVAIAGVGLWYARPLEPIARVVDAPQIRIVDEPEVHAIDGRGFAQPVPPVPRHPAHTAPPVPEVVHMHMGTPPPPLRDFDEVLGRR